MSEQVRAALLASDATIYQVMKRTGLDRKSLYGFARGKRGLTIASLDRLAEALELEVVKRQRRMK